ncbi:MAG: 1,6-anhydro-N-acetylmuramyl-L-alanine amidase AmpD [Gammaproteobacteria bacterium]
METPARLFRIDPGTGRLPAARWVPSPNCDARPPGVTPDLVVIHGISLPPGEFGGSWIEALFTNRLDPTAHPFFTEIESLRVSAHLLIRRDGGMIQFVSFNDRAWHAGASCYGGRENCNDFAIGIELEGTDEVPYRDEQYEQLTAVVTALLEAYPTLSSERIVGHCDIAPGRKSDPGPAFDWQRLRAGLE